MSIHYYKQPHKIIKVDYKKAVKEVWDTHISDDKTEDKMAKKTIANINIGLLEKSNNKRQNSKNILFIEGSVLLPKFVWR